MDSSNTNRALLTGLTFIVITLLCIAYTFTFNQGKAAQLHNMRAVSTICASGNTNLCQEAEEQSHTEYICQVTNDKQYCWVEVK